MATVVEVSFPASAIALGEAFADVPGLEFRLEDRAATDDDTTPYVWLSGPSQDAVEAALERDPSVEIRSKVTEDGADEWLYRLEFETGLDAVVEIVFEENGTVLDAAGSDGRWLVRALFPDRDSVPAVVEGFDERGIAYDIERMIELDADASSPGRLSGTQYETLAVARERGYYDVPRGTSLEELAEELGVSQQALSERLRPAHGELVDEALGSNIGDVDVSESSTP